MTMQNILFSLLRLHISNFVYTQEMNIDALIKVYTAKMNCNGVPPGS